MGMTAFWNQYVQNEDRATPAHGGKNIYQRRTFEPSETKTSNDIRAKLEEVEQMLCKIGPCRERGLALTKLDEAMLWANVAIAQAGVEDYMQ